MYRRLPFLTGVCWLSLFCFVASASDLFYDGQTGDIFLNIPPNGNESFAGFSLSSSERLFDAASYRRLGGPTDLFIVDEGNITEGGALVGGYPKGLYRLGMIYPENVSEAAFIADITGQWANLGSTESQALSLNYGRPDGVALNEDGIAQVDQWASVVSLTYLAPTGELLLSTDGADGGFVMAFQIVGSFTGEATFDKGGRFTSSDDVLESFGLVPPGTYSFGKVLPSGLAEADLANWLTEAQFLTQPDIGQLIVEWDGTPMNVAFVPEPSALLSGILGIGVCLSFFRRRKIHQRS